MAPEKTRTLIKETACLAARNCREIPALIWAPPYRLMVTYRDAETAAAVAGRSGARMLDKRIIEMQGDSLFALDF